MQIVKRVPPFLARVSLLSFSMVRLLMVGVCWLELILVKLACLEKVLSKVKLLQMTTVEEAVKDA